MRYLFLVRVRRYGDVASLFSGGGGLAALANLYDTMEFRTAVTPPAVVDLKGALDSSGGPSPVAQFLQPTIILTGPAGQQTIAPYGVAPDGTAATIGLVMLLMGFGYVIGWTARKRKHPGLTA